MKSLAALLVILLVADCVTSRWLPTRDNTNKLDKLREMLKEILESEYEKSMYDKVAVFKREVGPSLDAAAPADSESNRKALGRNLQ